MRYAEIKGGVCVNTVEADEAFSKITKLVALPDGFGIGDFYTGDIWSHEVLEVEPEPTTEEILNALLGVTE